MAACLLQLPQLRVLPTCSPAVGPAAFPHACPRWRNIAFSDEQLLAYWPSIVSKGIAEALVPRTDR